MDLSTLRPLDNRIVARRLPEPGDGSSHLIAAPDSVIPLSRYGEVLAVGPGEQLCATGAHVPIPIAPGERIWWGGVKDDRDDLVILREFSVRAVESESGIRVIGDRILIRRDAAPETTPSGLVYIPETAREQTLTGTVVAVGEGQLLHDGTREPLDVQPGDRVLVRWHMQDQSFLEESIAAETVEFREEKYLVTAAEDVVGVVERDTFSEEELAITPENCPLFGSPAAWTDFANALDATDREKL